MQHRIPPATEPRRGAMAEAVSSCVHCGFCLPACPTYKVLGEEMDSPRGRIVLMKEVLEGGLALADAAPHLDRCLGCLACETACPSGVRYRDLIEPMREDLVAQRPAGARLHLQGLLRVMASPALFRAAAALGAGAKALAPALPASMRAMLDLLPAHLPAPDAPPSFIAPQGRRRGRVALMTGCVQSVLRPGVTHAAIRVLAAQGVEVVVPPAQGCCGALARHAGDHTHGTALAAAHASRFPVDVDAVVATAAGCGSSMKDTHTSGAPVRDVLEYLDHLGLVTPLALAAPVRVAYQDACHLAHAQQITAAPRRLLGRIDGLTLVPLAESGLCCGSAGLYNVEQPALAAALGRRKADAVAVSGATMVVSANIGCLTQLGVSLAAAGHTVDVAHAIELLAMALPGRRGPQ
jgi:glycolate oxidase iron-sulfur subunit